MTALSSSPTEARLREALEAVYQAFAAPVPRVIEGCPCCIDTRGVDILLSTPLRDISGQSLWSYVSGLFYTVGGVRDFRYLLPRILDISINDRYNAYDSEVVLGKLALADWQSWSPGDRRVVENLIDAWFEQALVRDLAEFAAGWDGREAEAVLCGAARAGLPLTRWLGRLRERDAEPILLDLKNSFPKGLSPFWEEAPDGLKELSLLLAEKPA